MTRSRGLTLLETLLALALLSGILIAATSWIELTARTRSELSGPTAWERAGRAALQCMIDDLRTGDFDPAPGPKTRIVVDEHQLIVHTRVSGVGPVKHAYVHRPLQMELVLESESSRGRMARLLLTEVESFSCALDEEKGLLEVRILSTSGQEVSRKVAIIE